MDKRHPDEIAKEAFDRRTFMFGGGPGKVLSVPHDSREPDEIGKEAFDRRTTLPVKRHVAPPLPAFLGGPGDEDEEPDSEVTPQNDNRGRK